MCPTNDPTARHASDFGRAGAFIVEAELVKANAKIDRLLAFIRRGVAVMKENGAALDCGKEHGQKRCVVCEWYAEARKILKEKR